ncbi:MAG: glycoside hydrolase family 13 protein [Clostridium sp.]|uniref:glycoside hydrolase family 13 protein n=1 Tax=Clostridium sp. TaxID=1506 RepID=UPI003F399021
MNKHAIYHITDVPYAYPLDKDTLRVRLKVAKDDIKEVRLYYRCRYEFEDDYKFVKMDLFEEDNLFEIYSKDINILRNRYRYYFKLLDLEGNISYYDERGIKSNVKNINELIPFQYAYIGEADIYKEAKWLQESIVYQIFPDRFSKGLMKKDSNLIRTWGDEVNTKSIFGGDIKGITNKVPYLRELGINLVYLTPIFVSPSNHKYNIDDYYKIDPNFGTIEDLKELVKTAHKSGIRIILDGVFNHTGYDFFAFKDILENGEMSKYKDWYHIDKFPLFEDNKINYYTFANDVINMPKLNTNNKDVRTYFINVLKYWIEETNIDGWRLDVCDEVDHKFWRAMRDGVKEVKEDSVLIGEIMHEGISFLRGEQLDSIMNYPFKHAMVDFFAKGKIDAKELTDALSMNRHVYMESITRQLLNLIGSHDTARFLTECNYDEDKIRLAVVFQFTYIGVPYIYYGDEIGTSGGEDPECRKCMQWNEKAQNLNLRLHYKKLISIRKENEELIHGDYKCLYEEGYIIAFRRRLRNKEVIIIINNSNKQDIIPLNIQGQFKELYSGENKNIDSAIKVAPMSFMILKKK